jgi:Calcineurin-like phosphoesterase
MIDFIGDIHGHADKLMELLEKLGYKARGGSYSHPIRKVLFVGDYIDRGPKIRETLMIVRQMVESGNAIALMGNHEYNALCFHYEEREGGHLRKHLIKNIIQHFATLQQFQNRQKEYEDYLEWFKTLPLFYETDSFRAVHACWDGDNISSLRSVLKDDKLNETTLHHSVLKGTDMYRTIDETLKGKEVRMPEGLSFFDKDATERNEIRIKWWQDPKQSSYREMSVIPLQSLPEESFDISLMHSTNYYSEQEKPVFFGHYWMNGHPEILRGNVCCLDYSVAKHGYLAAYRFDGERVLSNDKFVFV